MEKMQQSTFHEYLASGMQFLPLVAVCIPKKVKVTVLLWYIKVSGIIRFAEFAKLYIYLRRCAVAYWRGSLQLNNPNINSKSII
jgi:hypothetical protein